MKKVMVVMGVCACLCLSGCIPPRYIKPGVSQERYALDMQECRYEAEKATASMPYGRGLDMTADIYRDMRIKMLVGECLKTRGYMVE